jgi:hypothetical protein
MEHVVAWTWKTHWNGERRGGMKAHAFENSTRRSLCRKYDDGSDWRADGMPPTGPEDECAVCRKEVARVNERCASRST